MYEGLVKRLRDDSAWKNCDFDFIYDWIHQAADAIEELSAKFVAEHELRVKALNRLCGWCGVCSKENRNAVGCDDIAQLDEVHAPRWISVEERLPEDGQWVLVWGHGQKIPTMMFRESGAWIDSCFEFHTTVTNWMPLPEPPKEET